jgi:hypothetical protein
VAGADAQRCPFCGEEAVDLTLAPQEDESLPLADPVGALAHAARVVRRRYLRILLLWVPVVLLDAAVALSVVAYQAANPGTEDLGALTTDQALSLLGVIAPLYFLDFVVTFAAWSWIARLVLGPSGASTDRGVKRAYPAASLAVGALLTLALLAGLVLLLVPALVLFHMFLFAPAALAGGTGVGGAFEASRRFSRERQTLGFTALMVILAALLLGATFALAALFRTGLDAAGVASPVAHALVEVLPGWLLWPLLAILPASYWALAQAAGRDDASRAQAQGPARGARSTKCPRCGTLIPYTPTGGAVDVTCPACGTSGRVL